MTIFSLKAWIDYSNYNTFGHFPIDDEYDSVERYTYEADENDKENKASYIGSLYEHLDGQRVYRKEDIGRMEAQLQALRSKAIPPEDIKKDRETGLSYIEKTEILTFIDAWGNEHQYKVPMSPWMYLGDVESFQNPELRFFSYQDLCDLFGREFAPIGWLTTRKFEWQNPILPHPKPAEMPEDLENWNRFNWYWLAKNFIPMYYFPAPIKIEPETEFDFKKAEQMRKDWEKKPERLAIMEAANRIDVRITEILCFGLGSFRLSNSAKFGDSIVLDQHFAIFDIASILHKKAPDAKIWIGFQDPAYEPSDHSYIKRLSELTGIPVQFHESPQGLYRLGQNSFVYSPGRATFPIQQLTADLTADCYGPAVCFWPTVYGARSDITSGTGTKEYTARDEANDWGKCKVNCPNWYVVEMLKGYDEILDTQKVVEKPSLYNSSLYVRNQGLIDAMSMETEQSAVDSS